MVKIKNVLGDVKIGRQGEVVYQRQHGEQIRRLASPKRAMASEAQIAHRQLYRDALVWRKSLSLPNRRYLEGYCIANGVIDSYHIPLPWSRFALKLYLQAVKFVVIEKPSITYKKTTDLYEHYEDGTGVGFAIFKTNWEGETFTPLEAHNCNKVALDVVRVGDLTGVSMVVGIRNTDGEGLPTGGDLTSKTIDANSIPTEHDWVEFKFETPTSLLASVKYAIVLRLVGEIGSNRIESRNAGGDPYPNGEVVRSSNSGSSWSAQTGYDRNFREYGETETEEAVPGLLHVRHPALLTVIHKRDGLNINGYDTLSSLDKEYLTGQVGLDVEAGDSIEATTLPGIDYRFKVV